ncbi:MAG: type II toxin-antitoxin system VapC family toxin [Chloroflexi bacterium]|nr:type II toxin-antitoxin system VapC family toxin [Chloroflexota bacterium]
MIVLDTNVVSEMALPAPNATVAGWVIRQPRSDLFLTAVSEAELRYGVEILPVGRRRRDLAAAVEKTVRQSFAGRILPFDSDAARAYAEIAAARRAAGDPISQADCQIAAIARSRGAAVATRDASGFGGCGIKVINPWQA